jgi:CxxC motif-containing protein (DUF1111 family)
MKPLPILAAAAALTLTTSLFASPRGGTVPPVGTYGGPSRPLTPAETARFLSGRAIFDRNFHKAEGLGNPNLNGDSCRACHQDPVLGGAGSLELNVSRMGFDNGGQGPFQDVPGGQILSKLRSPWVPLREEYDPTVPDVFEQRQPPTLFGLGLIDSIPDSEILSHEDPMDLNNDGIRGVARRVTVLGNTEIGRFGWKAQIPRLTDFISDAMGNELGVTTPDDGRGFAIVTDTDPVADPEFAGTEFGDLAFFMTLVGPPPRGGNADDPTVQFGEKLFSLIGCARCHVPEMQGPDGPVPLYSDLLLHHVMKRTFRGMAESGAPAGFYRTPPLWGISQTAPYMHDGRAESLVEAINAHRSEANRVRLAFKRIPQSYRNAIIAFLNDL